MGLIYNGNEVKNLIYNGQQVNVLKYNGEIVWKRAVPINAKYNELATIIPKLTADTYDLTVDCSGVAASEFRGYRMPQNVYCSPFGQKLNAAPKGVYFNLKPINVGADVTSTYSMFLKCSSLTNIDTSAFTNVTNAMYMFRDCSSLTSIDTKAFTKVTSAFGMFFNCSSLTSIDTKSFTNVTNANSMFNGCGSLTSIDTKAFTKVTYAEYMFNGCGSLTSIDTSVFTKVTSANSMFRDCSSLTSITWGDSFRPTESVINMFNGATAAKTITASTDSKKFIEANATAMSLTNYKIVLK